MPDQKTRQHRYRAVKRILIGVLFLNLFVAVAKIVVGLQSGLLSLIADGAHSTLDAMSNVVGIIGITAAARPPDRNHPYGHSKYETLASMAIGFLVLLTAVELIEEAATRFKVGGHPEVGAIQFGVLVVTIFINVSISVYEARAAKKYKSDILAADSLHTRSDIFVSCGVLIGLFLTYSGVRMVDPVVTLLVTAAILYSAWLIFSHASVVLSDSTSLEAQEVEEAAMSVAGVLSVEKIRSRGSENLLSVDLHIRVHPEITITEAHEITHLVRAAVEDTTGARDVIIHTEPEQPEEQTANDQGSVVR